MNGYFQINMYKLNKFILILSDWLSIEDLHFYWLLFLNVTYLLCFRQKNIVYNIMFFYKDENLNERRRFEWNRPWLVPNALIQKLPFCKCHGFDRLK